MQSNKHAILSFIFTVTWGFGQSPAVPLPGSDSVRIAPVATFPANKEIPSEIVPQVLEALSCYPELNQVPILFRFRRQTAPLTSRPRLLHIFKKPGRRTYVITLSRKTKKSIEPILFHHLGYEAQIGVLGHELAHIATYEFLSAGELISLGFKMLNPRFVDGFEFRADQSCIDHGLGPQLQSWSIQVRERLDIPEWKGFQKPFGSGQDHKAVQRYMNPETIAEKIALCPHVSLRSLTSEEDAHQEDQ